MQSPKCQKKGVCLIKIYSELKSSWVKPRQRQLLPKSSARYMHYASRRAPVLSLRATAAAELEMVIDWIYKCHYCQHCTWRWLQDCFSVVVMIIFSLYSASSHNARQCLFFSDVATKNKMFMEMYFRFVTLLVKQTP